MDGIIPPEGGFLRKRREVSKRFAQKNNLPVLEHFTLPRVGAIKAIMEAMCLPNEVGQVNNNSPNAVPNGDFFEKQFNASSNKNDSESECLLEYILDITIAYLEGKPLDLSDIVHGMRSSCKTYMLYRLYKIKEIPKDSDPLSQWLYDRFVEKNNLLENYF